MAVRVEYNKTFFNKVKRWIEENPYARTKDIAEKFNIPQLQVSSFLRYFGFILQEWKHEKIAEDYVSGLTYKEISEKYKISKNQIYRIVDKKGVKVKEIKRRKLRNFEEVCYKHNFNLAQIAKFYNTDSKTVKKRILKIPKLKKDFLENRKNNNRTGENKGKIKNKVIELCKYGIPKEKEKRREFIEKISQLTNSKKEYIRKLISKIEKEYHSSDKLSS